MIEQILITTLLTLLFLGVCWINYQECVNVGDAKLSGVILSAILYFAIGWLSSKYFGKDFGIIISFTLAAPFAAGFVAGGNSHK